MELLSVIIIIVGLIICLFIVLKIISKRGDKEWLIFEHKDNDKSSYWGQHRKTGITTEKF